MKLYYDSDADDIPDTEVTGIIQYPMITTRLDKPSTCIISISDFEGALYATWEPRDFTKMSVKDDDGEQIFIGYLVSKKYTSKSLDLTLIGFGANLNWKRFDYNYVIEEGRLRNIVDGETITCYDDIDADGDYGGAGEDFSWVADQWITDLQNKGIIVEQPIDYDVELWKCSDVEDNGDMDLEVGDHTHTRTYLDGNEYKGIMEDTADGMTIEFTIDPTWDGGEDVIPDTKFLRDFRIDWRYSLHAGITGLISTAYIYLQLYNYNTSSWGKKLTRITYSGSERMQRKTRDTVGGKKHITSPLSSTIMEESATLDLSDYLDDDGAGNWDEMKIRMVFVSNEIAANMTAWVDYLAVRINYHTDNINAIMLPINDNAASTITSYGADWDNLGVGEDDAFKIGENTKQIIDDIISEAGLSSNIIDGFDNSGTRTTVYPTGDDAAGWDNSTGGNHYGELDDANDATYIDTVTDGDIDIFTFDTLNLQGGYVTAIEVNIRQKCNVIERCSILIYYSVDGGTSWSSMKYDTLTAAWANETSTWGGLEIREMDDFQVKLYYDESVPAGQAYVSELYVDFTLALPNFDKYDSRNFKGSFCIDGLKKMLNLEGAHWTEDHALEHIMVVKPADFLDNTINLTSADYDFDWEFEDICNSINSVKVFGNAALGIVATSSAGDANSPIERQIIDEGINAYSIAMDMAEEEVGRLATKRPNIKLSLDGVRKELKVGTKVHITFERPTIAQAFYKIRQIKRERRGIDGIKTTIWCGLGQTDLEEKIANGILNASYSAHDAHQARLTATVASSAANITWGDVGGGQVAVEAIISTEVGAGESIDNAIDTLIAAAGHETAANVESYLAIGVGNKRWTALMYAGQPHAGGVNQMSTSVYEWYTGVVAGVIRVNFIFPLPLTIGSKNLYITQTKCGIYDALEGDEIDRVRIYGRGDDGTTMTTILDTGAGLDEDTVGTYTWDHADTQIGGQGYMLLDWRIGIKSGVAGGFGLSWAAVEYYYA